MFELPLLAYGYGQAAIGGWHCLAVDEDGRAYAWGKCHYEPILFLEGIRTYIVVTDNSSTTREVGTTKSCQQLAMQMLIGLNMQVEMSMDNVLRSWIAKGSTKYCIEISLSHNAVALVFVCGRYFHPLSPMGMPH
jgi:alpha-tubulin suppressor-like RCC1 family protein